MLPYITAGYYYQTFLKLDSMRVVLNTRLFTQVKVSNDTAVLKNSILFPNG